MKKIKNMAKNGEKFNRRLSLITLNMFVELLTFENQIVENYRL